MNASIRVGGSGEQAGWKSDAKHVNQQAVRNDGPDKPRTADGQREHDEIHEQPHANAVGEADAEWPAPQRRHAAADDEKRQDDHEGDEVMNGDAEERRTKAARERGSTDKTGCDALENLDRRRPPEQVEEDHSIERVERSDGQRAKQDGALRGHDRSDRRTQYLGRLLGIVVTNEELDAAEPQTRLRAARTVGVDHRFNLSCFERALSELGIESIEIGADNDQLGMVHDSRDTI